MHWRDGRCIHEICAWMSINYTLGSYIWYSLLIRPPIGRPSCIVALVSSTWVLYHCPTTPSSTSPPRRMSSLSAGSDACPRGGATYLRRRAQVPPRPAPHLHRILPRGRTRPRPRHAASGHGREHRQSPQGRRGLWDVVQQQPRRLHLVPPR